MRILRLLFFALFITFPFGQLAKLPLDIPGVNIYLHDILVSLILLTWIGRHIFKKKKIEFPSLAKPILGFIITAFVSLTLAVPKYSLNESIVSSCYLLRWITYTGIYFVVWENTWLHGYVVAWLLGAGVISAILGLLQYIFLPDTRFLFYSGWDRHYYRVIGAFLDPGFMGMIYVLVLILIATKLLESFKTKKLFTFLFPRNPTLWAFLLFTLVYLTLALTYSRASYLAFLVGVGVIALMRRSIKVILIVILVLLATLFILPRPGGEGVKLERTSSVKARAENYKYSLKIIKDHPFLGVGFNFYRYAQKDYGFLKEDWQTSHSGAGADSSLFFVMSTTGLIGLSFYLWLLWGMIKIHPASTLALIVHSFFNNSLFYPWIMLWMWILLGTKECKKQ